MLSEAYIRQRNSGENYAALADFRNTASLSHLNEADVDGLSLVEDVYQHARTSGEKIFVAGELARNGWFSSLSELSEHKRVSRLMEWFKQAAFNFLEDAGLHMEILRNVLTPKEIADLSKIMRNGGDGEAEINRLSYMLANTYRSELIHWWDKQFGSAITEDQERLLKDELQYEFADDIIKFIANDSVVAQEHVASLSNMPERDLFEYVYNMALQYVPNVELIEVVDFMLQLQNDIDAQVADGVLEGNLHSSIPYWNGGQLAGGAKALLEDDPVEDQLTAITNDDSDAAEDRFGALQNGETDAFDDADGDYKLKKAANYGTPSSNPLDKQISDEVVANSAAQEAVEVQIEVLKDFDELSMIPVGEGDMPVQDMTTYEINNEVVSKLPFYLTVDVAGNQCIVNVLDANAEPLPELALQVLDYALNTQLSPDGEWVGLQQQEDIAAVDDVEAEQVQDNAPEEGVAVEGNKAQFESLSKRRVRAALLEDDLSSTEDSLAMLDGAADDSLSRLNVSMGAGNSGISQYQNLGTSDPEVAFDLKVVENDDGSVAVVGNIPVVINALCAMQADEVKANLLGDAEDVFNYENNPTVEEW